MSTTPPLDASATRAGLERAAHVPGAIYSSPEIYAREVEVYFRRDWLMVGRVEELAEPGDYMTLRIAGEPVVVEGVQRMRPGIEVNFVPPLGPAT